MHASYEQWKNKKDKFINMSDPSSISEQFIA